MKSATKKKLHLVGTSSTKHLINIPATMQSYTCTVWWPLSLWCEFVPFCLEDAMSCSLSCLALWKSLITFVSIGCYMQWYQSIHLLIQCGLGTNQVEAGGHVTPWRCEWSSVHKTWQWAAPGIFQQK